MARTYRRDARGRFAGGGYSGQSGGRGARLKGGGAKRAGGGAKMSAARVGGTVAKPRGLKPGAIKAKTAPTPKPAAKLARRKKTQTEILSQADRIIGKANKAAAKAISSVGQNGLEKTQRIVNRSIRRSQYLVPGMLQRRGLMNEYARRTAVADDFLRIRQGPGIKPARRRR